MEYIVGLINYDGSCAQGFQQQAGLEIATIESFLQQAIKDFSGEQPRVIDCAGRTDKGVHALNQVIGFFSSVQRDRVKWITGLEHFLPSFIGIQDIKILKAENKVFHPRFSAQARTYRYYFLKTPHRALVQQGLTLLRQPYDLALLERCAQSIEGSHDFKAFQGGSCQAKSTIKTCYAARWYEQGPLLIFDIKANAFLHHMVRYLVGCQLAVATGREDFSWFQDLLNLKAVQAYCVSPQGLYLADIEYPSELISFPTKQIYPWFDSRFYNPN